MKKMEIQVLFPKGNLSKANEEHKIYSYLLRNLNRDHPNHVWCTDITSIRLDHGFAYLVASWIGIRKRFRAWNFSKQQKNPNPKIFNTDQSSQLISPDFTGVLDDDGIKIRMDGKW